jgi:sulfhydrogenase subunit delta
MTTATKAPTLAVWKFSSCDGCQLTLLNCEDELLTIAGSVHIASFTEASSAVEPGPYDLSIVEGSITTPEDAERIRDVRAASRYLVTIGACATAGGIQALRNFADDLTPVVYASPQYIRSLRTSTPVADHVPVDFELRGCPVDRRQLLEVIQAFLAGRKPNIRGHSVCIECKRAGRTCVLVAHGAPCLGPVTQAGCGALCPAFGRGCYGCFGPMESPNTASLSARWRELGADGPVLARAFSGVTAAAEPFRAAAKAAEAAEAVKAAEAAEEAATDDAR